MPVVWIRFLISTTVVRIRILISTTVVRIRILILIASVVIITCLFVLRLNVPVNNFSVISGQSHCFLGITSSFLNKVSCSRTQHVGGRFRNPYLSLRVRCSTTEPPRSPADIIHHKERILDWLTCESHVIPC